MSNSMIQLLDCTLRDGAYINGADFGKETITGIIKRLQNAKVEIIECGWLKDFEHKESSSYFHIPSDLKPYILKKDQSVTYVAMIDFDRYDLNSLPQNDNSALDAIRVVFPKGKATEGANVARKIREKGYHIFCQAANTLGYSDYELLELIKVMNELCPECVSIVDTFGAMYPEDLTRILSIFVNNLDRRIKVGFHSHNNQQLSFALTIQFVRYMKEQGWPIVVDSSLCGMGRGAGNATTELVTSFLNKKYYGNYDLDLIMDTIDTYMVPFQEKYSWGYSIPTYIAGSYCSHVNNIDYLLKKHRSTAKEIRSVISSLKPEERIKYDYDLLESKYIENQNNEIEDEKAFDFLKNQLKNREILIIAPGVSAIEQKDKIQEYINANNPIVIAVNALLKNYSYDYLFLKSKVRYEYLSDAHSEIFENIPKILLSNVKTDNLRENEYVIRYERAIKRGWKNFDNAVICLLRLLDKLSVQKIAIAGFDNFTGMYNESYADPKLPTTTFGDSNWQETNSEIREILSDFISRLKADVCIEFITETDLCKF